MFNNFKVDSNKQMSQVKKSIQDLHQKVSSVDQNVSKTDEKCNNTRRKFSKEITVLENNQPELLKMKESINHKNQKENIINRQDGAEQRILESKHKVEECYVQTAAKKKII